MRRGREFGGFFETPRCQKTSIAEIRTAYLYLDRYYTIYFIFEKVLLARYAFFCILARMLTITFEKRDTTQKLSALRNAGKLPAVFYGRKESSTPITVPAGEFLKVWKKAGETSIVELKGLNDGADHQALIKDIDSDPLTGDVRHVDFYVIEKGKKLELSVPIHFVGVSAAVKELSGILVKVLHELKIEALPKDLPHSVEVDIAPLVNFESQILAKDIKLPEGVILKEKAEEVVASVAQPKEEPEEPVAPIDLSAIEVEKKGKKEDEEGAAAEGVADAKKDVKAEAKK
jgi:large subunit ribosomal protein L25